MEKWKKVGNVAKGNVEELLKDEEAQKERTTLNIFPRDIGQKIEKEIVIYVRKKANSKFRQNNFYSFILTGEHKGQTAFFINFDFEPESFYKIKRVSDDLVKVIKITNEERILKLNKLVAELFNTKPSPIVHYTTDAEEEMPF